MGYKGEYTVFTVNVKPSLLFDVHEYTSGFQCLASRLRNMNTMMINTTTEKAANCHADRTESSPCPRTCPKYALETVSKDLPRKNTMKNL